MKQILTFLFSLFFLTSINSVAQVVTDTFYVSKDAFVNSGATSTNYGSNDDLKVFHDTGATVHVYRSYLQFDLSNIPVDALITSATLWLVPDSINNTKDHPIYIEKVDTTSWYEDSITWANQPPTYTTDRVSVLHSQTTSTSLHAFNVKNHVQYFVRYAYNNNGWRIRLQDETDTSDFGLIYYSSDHDSIQWRPSLEVKYVMPIDISTYVTHCTPSNSDGSVNVTLSGGTGSYGQYWWMSENSTGGVTIIETSSTVNDSTIDISSLGPGSYIFRVRDAQWSIDQDNKYYSYKRVIIGREGEVTSITIRPNATYGEDAPVSHQKIAGDDNDNTPNPTNIYLIATQHPVSWGSGAKYDTRALLKFQMDFDPALSFDTARLYLQTQYGHYRYYTATNESYVSRITSPWNESVVTWNCAPTTTIADQVYLGQSAGTGYTYEPYNLSILDFVEYWQMHPDENHGVEIAQIDYNQPYGSRLGFSTSDAGTKAPTLILYFTVKPQIETNYIDSLELGDITVNAPAGELPFKYLIGYDTLPPMDTLWYALRDSISIDSVSFYAGNVNSRNYTFYGMPAGRYFVGVYDNNGVKIMDASTVVSQEVLVYYSVDMVDTLGVLSVLSTADSARATLFGLLPRDKDGGFEFEVTNLDGKVVIGFNREMDTIPFVDRLFEYSIEIDSTGHFEIRKSGIFLDSGSTVIGDRFRMVKYDGEIVVSKNGVEVVSDPYPGIHGAYKVELLLKGEHAHFSKPHFIEALRKPRSVVSLIKYPDCPDGGGSIQLTFLTSGYFKEESQQFTITNIHTGISFSDISPGGTYSLPMGVYYITYSTSVFMGGSWVSLIGGGSEYFTIGYPIDWQWNPTTGNITEVPATLNTITPTVYGLATAYSANKNEFDETNWVEFNWSGPITTSSLPPYSIYMNYFVKVGLTNTSGSNPARVEIYNPGYGVICGWVEIYSEADYQGYFLAYNNKPIRIEFDTDATGESDNFVVHHNGNNWPITTASVAGKFFVSAQELNKVQLIKTVASFCPNYIPDQYVTPKRKLEGMYYLVPTNNVLMFEFNEEYTLASDLNYIVRDFTGTQPLSFSAPALADDFGDNRLSLDVSDLNAGYYVLEIYNDKNEKWFLRFQVQ